LTAADEITAMENLAVLQSNGFEISVDEDATVGRRLHLIAQPESKGTVFDMQGVSGFAPRNPCEAEAKTVADLEELLSLMHDQPPGHMVRCSKARNMFASRACRKSIMIGKALTNGQMTGVSNTARVGSLSSPLIKIQVIRHMGMTDQPWSCPHGRPTMRHLVSLREVDALKKFKRREIQWKVFGELLGLT
jgi:DNA mismatch repair protein PMS2